MKKDNLIKFEYDEMHGAYVLKVLDHKIYPFFVDDPEVDKLKKVIKTKKKTVHMTQ